MLVGLANSYLISEAKNVGLITASEVFADRRYEDDGQLVSRKESDAVITDTDEALKQVLKMVRKIKLFQKNNKGVTLQADTICVHGDGEHALLFVSKFREILMKEGIDINPYRGLKNGKIETKKVTLNSQKIIKGYY
ncbi:LamB/YcsF family protein [Staphylococcus aureus]